MLAASPPEGCSTNNNDALGFKVLGTYSMKVRSRPPTVLTRRVASPIGSAATAVATSANAAPIVQCGSVVSAMIFAAPFHTRLYTTPGDMSARDRARGGIAAGRKYCRSTSIAAVRFHDLTLKNRTLSPLFERFIARP